MIKVSSETVMGMKKETTYLDSGTLVIYYDLTVTAL